MEKVVNIIEDVKWKHTKHVSSHEYIHNSWVDINEMLEFIEYIKENGERQKFGNSYYIYLYVGGYKYWFCRDFQRTGWCINRVKV